MLVISRRIGESIKCRTNKGELITITVVQVNVGGQVRIGIDAPRSVQIVREEIRFTTKEEEENRE